MMLNRQVSTDGHIVRLGAEHAPHGWDVYEAVDAVTVHVEHHEDWHHVERAIRRLEMEVLNHGVAALTGHR